MLLAVLLTFSLIIRLYGLHHYVVQTNIPAEDLLVLVNKERGFIYGEIKHFGVYHVGLLEQLEPATKPNSTQRNTSLSLWKRQGQEYRIHEHPEVELMHQPYLRVSRRASDPYAYKPKYSEAELANYGVHAKPKYLVLKTDAEYAVRYRRLVETLRELHPLNDPAAKLAWQYLNDGNRSSGIVGYDMNVYPAYLLGYTGNSSNAVVLDDGLDTKHHDLKANYDPTISINLDNGNEDDPRGPFRIMKPDEAHGTQCAGLIAAVGNNEICSHGIAYHAKIGVVRMLSGKVNDIIEARSLSHNVEKVAMYCASWGPTDDGFTMDKPRANTEMAMKYASIHGRNNHGTLLLFASGNGGAVGDHCGADGFVSSPHVIAIAALDHQGARTMYSESCSGTRVAVPVGSPQVTPENPADLLPTTTENNKCVLSFMGTSAAAPLAAGCFALALEARPEISKRDFENLLPWSARIPTPSDEGWIVNAAGILYNSHAGYGLLDCTQLVQLAKQWHPVGPLCIARSSHGSDMGKKWANHQDTYPKDKDFHSLDTQEEVLQFQKKQKALRIGRPKAIVVRKKKMATIVIPIHKPTYPVGGTEQCTPDVVEKVIATFQWSHICRGTMSITLKSPSQTRVLLLGPRSADYYSGEGSINITSVAFWGEDVYGDWTIEVRSENKCENPFVNRMTDDYMGVFLYAQLEIWGSRNEDSGYQKNRQILSPLLTTVGLQAARSHLGRALNATEISSTFDEQRWKALRNSERIVRSVKRNRLKNSSTMAQTYQPSSKR